MSEAFAATNVSVSDLPQHPIMRTVVEHWFRAKETHYLTFVLRTTHTRVRTIERVKRVGDSVVHRSWVSYSAYRSEAARLAATPGVSETSRRKDYRR